jgi:CBS domain-containing protein
MAISQFMESNVVSCPPETTLTQGARLMKANNVGTIIIQKNGKPEGILTDRDLAIKALAVGKNCDATLVRDIMTSPVLSAKVSDGIYEVIDKMKQGKVRRMPVLNGGGKLIGIISFGDIIGLLSDELSRLSQAVTPYKSLSSSKKAA